MAELSTDYLSTQFAHICPSCGLEVNALTITCPVDGTNLFAPFEQEPCFRNRYKFIGTLGIGGMGIIYKARQVMLNKTVAIKMVHHQLLSPNGFLRFLLEGRAAAMLTHPYIIKVHDFGTTEAGQPYLIMDYVDGQSLSEVFAASPRMPIERFLRIFAQICEAMAHAHGHGVLHRDLKPGNIMVVRNHDGEEEIRIMDFGVAKLLREDSHDKLSISGIGATIGSPLYMSPEQSRGQIADIRSDLYSLGCVMYEALNGAPPFEGKTKLHTMLKHQNEQPAPVAIDTKDKLLEQKLRAIVMRLLQKHPDSRYQSMNDLHAELTGITFALAKAKLTCKKSLAVKIIEFAPRQTLKYARAIVAALVALPAVALLSQQCTTEETPKKDSAPLTANADASTRHQRHIPFLSNRSAIGSDSNRQLPVVNSMSDTYEAYADYSCESSDSARYFFDNYQMQPREAKALETYSKTPRTYSGRFYTRLPWLRKDV